MKTRKLILASCSTLILGSACNFNHDSKNSGHERGKNTFPNIVYIMGDDLGIGDPQCYNDDGKIPTPNIDQLAKEGVLFTNAHAGTALCTPSRYSILTGRYSWRSKLKKGVIFNYSSPLLDKDIPTVATFLKQNGYNTAAFGKWHLGFDWKTTDGKYTPFRVSSLSTKNIDFKREFEDCPLDHGFDYYFGIPGSNDMGPYLYIENRRVVGTPDIWATKENFPMMRGKRETWMTPGYKLSELDSTFTAKAKDFIQKQDRNTPFFMYYCASAPHFPYDPPKYAKGKTKAGNRGDMVYVFDHNVGELVKMLKAKGLYENTIIILTSDNGPLPGDSPMGKDPGGGEFLTYGHHSMGQLKGLKGDVFEGGHRVPLIISWHGKSLKGYRCDQQVCLVDIFGLAGQVLKRNIPSSALDSYGFLPLITQKDPSFKRPEPIINYAGGVYAVQDYDGWKYIHENQLGGGIYSWKGHGIVADPVGPIPGSEGLLYNLSDDLSEKENLFEQKPDKVNELAKKIKQVISK